MASIVEQIVRIVTDGEETRAEVICEIVRCKNCVHWGSTISQVEREQCASQGVDLVCNYWESDGLYAEDFCSYGERKKRSEDGN